MCNACHLMESYFNVGMAVFADATSGIFASQIPGGLRRMK